MGKSNGKALSKTQLRSWISERSVSELRTLAGLIGRRVPKLPVPENSTRDRLLYGEQYTDEELGCADPADALHWLVASEMARTKGTKLQNTNHALVCEFGQYASALVRHREETIARNPPYPDFVRATKILYLREQRELSFGKISKLIDIKRKSERKDTRRDYDATEKAYKRIRKYIDDRKFSLNELKLLVHVEENGIDDLENQWGKITRTQ